MRGASWIPTSLTSTPQRSVESSSALLPPELTSSTFFYILTYFVSVSSSPWVVKMATQVNLGPPFERGGKKNGWSPADATEFPVRGSGYLTDKKKASSKPSAFNTIGVHGFTSADKVPFVTNSPNLAPFERKPRANGKPHFLFVMHFDIAPQHLVLAYELDEEVLTHVSKPCDDCRPTFHSSARNVYALT